MEHERKQITKNKLILYIILGNTIGLVFPPSLITLISVILISQFMSISVIPNLFRDLVSGSILHSGISLKLKMLQKIENEIIPQADGTSQVRVGPFSDKKQATEMKGKMDGAGFPSEIQAEESKVQGYSLKAGKFATREEANKTISTLKQKGLKAEIVSLE